MSNVANQARAKAEDATASLSNAASGMAQDAGNYVQDMSKNVASSVGKGAEQAATYMGHRAEDAKTALGGSLKSAGESLRAACPEEESMMHSAACSVADTLENTGKYIEEQGFNGMVEDITATIKRNPIPAIFIAAGIGFLVARACTSSSRS
ncbi:hypothetical protein NA78x_003997 [Anatilimnocola sp. NA78]|uniref:hypothetical protein n=1 Tax=Anatilimnocola sp. NA78 TaxID=3415683 RepID=UPI003CE4EAAC